MLPCTVLGLSALGLLAIVRPQAAAWLCAKEGPLEQLGHVLLLVAVLGWLWAATEARGAERRRERRLCVGLGLLCALVLGEELDWGGVLGVTALSEPLVAAVGRANLHNAWRGGSYVLFAVPLVLLVGVVGWRRGDAPGRLPRRRDALGLGVLALVSVVGSLGWPAGEPLLDEAVETVLYLGLGFMAVRPVG